MTHSVPQAAPLRARFRIGVEACNAAGDMLERHGCTLVLPACLMMLGLVWAALTSTSGVLLAAAMLFCFAVLIVLPALMALSDHDPSAPLHRVLAILSRPILLALAGMAAIGLLAALAPGLPASADPESTATPSGGMIPFLLISALAVFAGLTLSSTWYRALRARLNGAARRPLAAALVADAALIGRHAPAVFTAIGVATFCILSTALIGHAVASAVLPGIAADSAAGIALRAAPVLPTLFLPALLLFATLGRIDAATGSHEASPQRA